MPVLHRTYLALVKVNGVLTGPLLRRMLVVRYLVTKGNQFISKKKAGSKVTNQYYQYVEKAK